MDKKAQITIIMIMVVIILVIFGIVYYVTKTSRERQSERELQTKQLAETTIKPIREYVKSCLDLVSKNALETLGKQGGFLFKSQGGSIIDYSNAQVNEKFIPYDNLRVGYSIFKPEGDVVIYKSVPPDYPWDVFPYIPSNGGVEEYYFGFFGYNELPPLKKPLKNSVQEQLEVYTKNNLDDCLDWSAFEKQNLEIIKQEPQISIVIGETTIVFNMNYPITIRDKTSETEQTLEEFSVIYDIRLKKFFEFIEYITDKDVTDIKFDISQQTGQDMSVDVVKDVANTKDDIIIVTDSQSTILDKQFEFRFARHNRNPALHFLIQEEITNHGEFGICNGANLAISKNYLQISNPQGCTSNPSSKMDKILLKAYDPDEDDLVYMLVIGQDRASYQVQASDFYQGQFRLRIKVTDGENTDWQDTSFPMKAIQIQ